MNLYELTIQKAHQMIKNKEISSVELTRAVFDRIDKIDHQVGAYITLTQALAMKQADHADQMIAKGKISLLTGIPVAIKDLICTKGIHTTCGSKILKNFIPPYNASIWTSLAWGRQRKIPV